MNIRNTKPRVWRDAGLGRCRRAALLAGVSLPVLLLGLPARPALAGTETISGSWTGAGTTAVPGIPPQQTEVTSFSGYNGGVYNYALYSFTVTASGNYSAVVTTTGVTNTTWFLTGLFSPGTPPSTPIGNFFAGVFAGGATPYTDDFTSLSLTTGTQYSVLIAFNIGGTFATDGFTLSLTGPGCAAIGTVTCSSNILSSNTYPASGLGGAVNPVFQGGTLQIDVAGQTYAQTLELGGSTTNTIDQAGKTATFSGVLADAAPGTPGGIIFANSATGGAITLTGVNTYTGSTTIDAGATLALAGAGSIAASSGLADNGTFDISGSAGGTAIASLSGGGQVVLGANGLTLTKAGDMFSGAIGGSGGLILAGGTETLAGANTYTGPTSIAGGAVLALAGAGSIAASAGVADNGTFDISGSTGGTAIASLSGNGQVVLGANNLNLTKAGEVFSGAIAGSGGLTLAGGTETLTGANTYTGATTIAGGAVLALAGAGSIAASAGIADNGTFDISGSAGNTAIASLSGGGQVVLGANNLTLTQAGDVFSGAITGSGGLTLAGGTELLAGANTYTGPTSIGQGATLQLLGSLASPVSVGSGGTLRGVGSIGGAVAVAGGGTLAVGASPGQLTVNAPVTLAQGAVLSVDIDGPTPGTGAGHYSTLAVTGSGNALTVAGTLVPVLRGITGAATNTYVPAIGQVLTVATAQGGVLGSFAGLTQPASGLPAGTRFDVLYAPSALSLVATPVAYGDLSLAGLAETSGEAAVGRALDAVRPAAGLRITGATAGLFDALYALPGPSIAPALDQLEPTIYGDGLMAARQTWYAMAGAVADQIAARRDGLAAGQTAAGPNGSTIWTSGLGQFTDVSGAGSSYHTGLGGAVAGIDMPVAPGLRLGAAAGGSSTQTSSNGASDSSASVQLTVYGGLRSGRLFLDGQAAYLHADQDVQRTGFWGTTRGNGHLNGGGGQLRGGVRLTRGAWQIEPELGFSLLSLTDAGLTETGGAASEQIGGQSVTSAQSLAGIRFGTRFLAGATPVAVHGLIGWEHEYADVSARTTAAFAGVGAGAGFSVSSAPIARDAARLGGGFDVAVTRAISLFGSYDAALGGASTAQNLTGGIRVSW